MKKNPVILFSVIVCAAFSIAAFIPFETQDPPTPGEIKCKCEMPLEIKTKNLKTDFGAKGDNKHNDSWSFLCAAEWLNKSCSDSFILKLYIPPGTYIVGMQLTPDQKITNPLCPSQSMINTHPYYPERFEYA